MIIEIPDVCGKCKITEPSSDGKLWCKHKANLISSIGCPPSDSCKVNPDDCRPDICPYNELIMLYSSRR